MHHTKSEFRQRNIEYSFKRSHRARRLRMQINEEGKLMIIAPLSISLEKIEHFISGNGEWIEKHIQKAKEKHQKIIPHRYQTGDVFWLLGEACQLIVKTSSKKRSKVQWQKNQLCVSIDKNTAESAQGGAVKKSLAIFFKKKADEVIRDRLEYLNEAYGFKYNWVTLRDQKSRWGSCSKKGNLNFNWRLIMAPIEIIDYVVVHELCHLRHLNHSHQFWSMVAESIHDHKARRRWLKEKGYLLRI